MRLHQLMEHHPGDLPAVIDHDGTRYTHGDLRRMSDELITALTDHGLRAGDRLILVAENSAYYSVVILAASRMDVWLTLVNARQTETELEAIRTHSGARMITFTTNASQAARGHATRVGATTHGSLPCGPIVLSPCYDATPEPVDDSDAQIAALIYTTGTTSAPKGVMLSHGNLIANARATSERNAAGPGDDMLAVLPGTHIFLFGSVWLASMATGCPVRFVPRFDVTEIIDHLRGGTTHFPGVPQMFAAIVTHLTTRGEHLNAPRLRHMTSGGAPLDPELKARAERLMGCALNNGYGLTETSPTVAVTRGEGPRDDISVGHPVGDIEIRIREPGDDGIGELEIKGPNVMQGYYRDPERTAEVLSPDGWFRSGDLARIDAAGALHIVGRLKELIIRSGFNVYPPEIEGMLTKHPNVFQAAVVGRPVAGDEEICAFVMTDGTVTPDQIKAWLHDRLTGYKVPQRLIIVDEYPSAATGKILKHKLLDSFASQLEDT